VGPSLAHLIDLRFEGARSVAEGERVQSQIPFEGLVYRARLESAPHARVSVALPCTDGFELTLRWNDRWANDKTPRSHTFDDSFLVETNDLALASVWLDREVRDALLASRYVSGKHASRETAVLIRDGSWVHEVSNDEVSARHRADGYSVDRPNGERPNNERITDILLASLLLASRPARWAKSFASTGRALGGEPALRVEVGGKPLLKVRRAGLEVVVRVVRRLGPGDPGRLRTIVSAHRHGSSGETLSLISDNLPRSAWPPPADPSGGTMTIDRRAAMLIDAAQPSSTMVRAHDVEIAFDGARIERDRLGAAIELAAYWASNARAAGPYR
jgi:hypothetical protein